MTNVPSRANFTDRKKNEWATLYESIVACSTTKCVRCHIGFPGFSPVNDHLFMGFVDCFAQLFYYLYLLCILVFGYSRCLVGGRYGFEETFSVESFVLSIHSPSSFPRNRVSLKVTVYRRVVRSCAWVRTHPSLHKNGEFPNWEENFLCEKQRKTCGFSVIVLRT